MSDGPRLTHEIRLLAMTTNTAENRKDAAAGASWTMAEQCSALRFPQKWEGEAPAEPWNSDKNGFDRSLTLPHKMRNGLEAVSFLDGGFMESHHSNSHTPWAHDPIHSRWGDTPWSRDLLQSQRKIRALQSIAPPRFMGRENLKRADTNRGHEPPPAPPRRGALLPVPVSGSLLGGVQGWFGSWRAWPSVAIR